jgi:para-aminobenzoate synthetase/4-amino-4-deoxychorismate lyase
MRTLYDAQYKIALENGLFDYIFCNNAGEVTEGCVTNLILYAGNHYITPPVASGLLPGVMRQHLLANKTVPLIERVVTRDDVNAAAALFVCNSVRGLVRVKIKNQ